MANDSPNSILDAVRDQVEWDDERRAVALGNLIARFEPEVLAVAVRPRLGSLGGLDGATLIELVEALARPDLFEVLADALVDQPDLPPDLAWLALDVLEGTGLVEERPELMMLRDDLDDLTEGEDPLETLAAQIVDDPDSALIAVGALSQVEPAIRREIIEGLGRRATDEPIRNFLRLLADVDDPAVREEARSALGLVPDHFARHGPTLLAPTSVAITIRPRVPRLIGSVVGPIDGEGRAVIVIRADGPEGSHVASFVCDVQLGIVTGGIVDLSAEFDPQSIVDRHDLARVLLAASVWLSGESTPDTARRALDLTLGTDLEPRPILAEGEAIGVATSDHDAQAVLSRRAGWIDGSELVHELAEAWTLRNEPGPPDPERDPGPFRVLFEGRILGRIDLYRRMLLWSALGWEANEENALAESAKRLAAQLGEPQNAVPGHRFLSKLMVRSLEAAIAARRSDG